MRNRRQQNSAMPEINLIPMMDVMMTILTFFIIVSMTLTGQQSVTVTLPSAKPDKTENKDPEPLVVGLNPQGQILMEDKPVTEFQLSQQVQDYLSKNPRGAVMLKADKKVAYEQVAKLLSTMRDVGGERVSLAIEG
jgi:biopolymer transport protein ExbD